jgi:predicted nucleotidyltransferase
LSPVGIEGFAVSRALDSDSTEGTSPLPNPTHAAYSQDNPVPRSTIEPLYRPIVQALQDAFGERLITVVLFGSQARGGARSESDHDLFVVIDGLSREPLARVRAVRATLLPIVDDLPGPVGFVAKTPAEVSANLTPLLLDVCAEGICLYGADYFEPHRQKALAAVRGSGLRRRKVGGALMWLFPRLPVTNWELSWEGYRDGS